jgi:hypothetical protein
MSIYTYKTHKALCELFNTEYYENPCLSDQQLDFIPENSTVAEPWNKGNDMFMGKNNPMAERTGEKHFFWGKTHTDYARKRISLALVERMKDYEYRTVECPHCHKVGGVNNMNRYHFDKCKSLQWSN